MKRKLLIAALLAVVATSAYAYCRTYTIIQGGRIVVCTECCTGGYCTVDCI